MASFCMCDQDRIWCDRMAENLFWLIHVLWSVLICFNGSSFIEFIGWVSFIVHSGFKCCFGWVPFIEHNVFKCWIIQQLWLTNISFLLCAGIAIYFSKTTSGLIRWVEVTVFLYLLTWPFWKEKWFYEFLSWYDRICNLDTY